jgi:hypothetical protein
MTSNSDDLIEQLQQNLKLRWQLGTEVAKARDSIEKPDKGTVYRFVWVLVWATLVASLPLVYGLS